MENSSNINSANNTIEYVKQNGTVELLAPKSQYSELETTHKMVTDFGCSVCYRVFSPPIKTRKCEHRLCHMCYVQMRRSIAPEHLTRPMTLCPECRSPLESVVRASPYHLPKISEVLHLDHAAQHELDILYNNCHVTGFGESLQIFSDTVESPLELRDIIFAPVRATNTVLNLGLFTGYLSACVGLSVGAGVVSGVFGLGRQLGSLVNQQEPSPTIHQAAKSGASWMFEKLSTVYDAIPYESTQLPLPVAAYLGLSYLDRKFLQGSTNGQGIMRDNGAEDRRQLYANISERIYQVCTPYQAVTDSTIAVFQYTKQCFAA